MTSTANSSITPVLVALDAVQVQDDANILGGNKAQDLRFDFAASVFRALKVRGITTTSIVDGIKLEKVARQARLSAIDPTLVDVFAPDMAYTSDGMIGYLGLVGHITTLPGDRPIDATVLRLMMAFKVIGTKVAKPIVTKRGQTQPEAIAQILKLAKDAKDDKDAEKDNALHFIKSATGPATKATEFVNATWDDATISAAEALLDILEAKLASVRTDRNVAAARLALVAQAA